jgi:hypothetical protein
MMSLLLLMMLLWRGLLYEDISAKRNTLGKRTREGCGGTGRSLLLLLLALFVFFFFIWGGLPVVICEIDLLCKFDAKAASLDPRCLRFQRQTFHAELLQHSGIIHTRYHVWRLYKRKRETGLQQDVLARMTRESELLP